MDVLRTPDERFTGLPGYAWPVSYVTTGDGLRLAVVDEGPRDAPVVLLLHGEPTWSYLYRRMIPVLLSAGLRVVAADNIGFGRSDKPTDVADHTYARHVEWLRSALFGARVDGGLDLTDVVVFCQDWGGLLGLRLVAEHPERFRAVCASNTGLPDGTTPMGEVWQGFKSFVDETPDLPVGWLVAAGCAKGLEPEVAAAYDAPFPDESFKAGPRAFPGLIPQSPDDVEAPRQRAAWSALAQFDKPFLVAFSDQDPITAGGDAVLRERVPGTAGQPHRTITGGGHFVQEDCGEQVADVLADWVCSL